MASLVWLNGSFVVEGTASVPLRDTGLLHGAGVFATMQSHGGRVFRLAQHLRRLRDSCEALFIPNTHTDDALAAAAEELLRQNDLSDARLRITVTRGAARNDPLHGLRLEPNVFITAAESRPYPAEYYERGMTVIVLDEQKLNPYDLQAGHKTLNYLSRLAAVREAGRRSAGEALWFNVHNYLESGSISNVFVVMEGRLVTPPTAAEMRDPEVARSVPYPRSAVLPGVTRAVVIGLARAEGIEVRTVAVNVNELLDADEVFLTNSVMGVMPVCRIERRAVGGDRPGPVTSQLAERLRQTIDTETRS